jgi:hypothetical protein
MALKTIMLRYLLMPLVAMVLAGLGAFIARKNKLLSNKQLIVFSLLSSLAMAVPGVLGLAGDDFFPWYYLAAQFIFLGLGIGFLPIYIHYVDQHTKTYRVLLQIIVELVVLTLGAYFFSMMYNICNRTRDGLLAASSVLSFPIPLIFYWTYNAFIRIPPEIYTVWQYQRGAGEIGVDGVDFDRLMILEIECFCHPGDGQRMRVKAKAPPDMKFGQWFKKFIDDYNRKFPERPIAYLNNGEMSYGWIFYCKRSLFHWRRLVDPELTILENRIQEHVTIVSKRVIGHSEEAF